MSGAETTRRPVAQRRIGGAEIALPLDSCKRHLLFWWPIMISILVGDSCFFKLFKLLFQLGRASDMG